MELKFSNYVTLIWMGVKCLRMGTTAERKIYFVFDLKGSTRGRSTFAKLKVISCSSVTQPSEPILMSSLILTIE